MACNDGMKWSRDRLRHLTANGAVRQYGRIS